MNQLRLNGVLLERGVMRYTPAGIPIVEGILSHQSEQLEAGQSRRVECEVKLLAAGPLALLLTQIPLNAELNCQGFLAKKNRNSKTLIYHVTELILQSSAQSEPH